MSSKKSGEAKAAAIKFKISHHAIFGDGINGRESERGEFTVNGELFMSMEPVSRQHAAEINHEMTMLRAALAAGGHVISPKESA